jgi:predicted permease
MATLRRFLSRVVGIFGRSRRDAELSEEIESHLDQLTAEHRRHGLSPHDARVAARRDFGGLDQVKEQMREQRGFRWLDVLRQDVRYAVRTLLRAPAFTLAAVGTLALGIGTTTAIFSVANAALLRPLPYPHAEELRTLRTTFTDGRVTSGLVANVELNRLKDPSLPIAKAAMSSRFDFTVLSDGAPRAVAAAGVDEQFFPLFGLPMAAGGGFTEGHFRRNGPTAVVISYRLWRTMFGGDPNVVGKTLPLTTGNMPIVGVASPLMDVPRGADVWTNVQLDPQDTNHSFDGYLRLRPSTADAVLSTRLAAVAAALGRELPGPEGNRAFIVDSFIETMVGDLRPMLIIVLGATALLLLLACVNVANLLLARASRRSREVAIRAAIGASRGRIAVQLLTESVVLVGAGTVAGLAMAYAAVRVLLFYGVSKFPRLETVPFGAPVLLFAIAMLVICALGVGLAPTLQLAGGDVERPLREGGRSVGGARSTHRALRIMIVAEVAVALTIVSGTGLLVRSFLNLQHDDPGFVSRGRLRFDVLLTSKQYRGVGVRRAWMQTVLQDLRGLPSVTAVAASSDFPMTGSGGRVLIQMDNWDDAHVHIVARNIVVTPAFFDAMGMRVTRGRGFTVDDRASTEPVVIVNESFVRKYLEGRDPFTAKLAFGLPRVNPASARRIVGVVNDAKYASLWSGAEPVFYLAHDQMGELVRLHVLVASTAADPRALIPAIRAEVQRMDPQLAFTVEAVQEMIAATLTRQKLGTTLMLLFGAIALLLAAIGIYGMIAYASAERHGEVATRMALGATRGNIFWLLSRQGLIVAAAGAVLGLTVAYATGRVAASWLYEVRPSDPVILASALALVLGVTIIATLIPVGRAARIDPSRALRFE